MNEYQLCILSVAIIHIYIYNRFIGFVTVFYYKCIFQTYYVTVFLWKEDVNVWVDAMKWNLDIKVPVQPHVPVWAQLGLTHQVLRMLAIKSLLHTAAVTGLPLFQWWKKDKKL